MKPNRLSAPYCTYSPSSEPSKAVARMIGINKRGNLFLIFLISNYRSARPVRDCTTDASHTILYMSRVHNRNLIYN